MNKIYIFGSSGFAVEVAQTVLSTAQYEFEGFIEKDDTVSSTEVSVYDKIYPIISETKFLDIVNSSQESIHCVIAIANGSICKKIFDRFKKYCSFPNIVSPHAILNDARIEGTGNIFFPFSYISWIVRIGSFNKFLPYVTIGHESIIGDYNEFNPKVSISGRSVIGNCNLFGMNSMLYQGKKVGNNNIIGMGAGIIRNVSNDKTLFGNPAKQL